MTTRATSPRFGSALVGTGAVSIVSAVLGLLSSTLIARILGPEGRGAYAAILNWPNFVAMVSLAGLQPATVYYAATDPAQLRTYQTSAICVAVTLAVPAIAIAWALMPHLLAAQSSSTVVAAQWFTVALVSGNLLWSIGLCGLQGLRAFREWNILRLAQVTIWVVVLVLLLLIGHPSAGRVSLAYAGTYFLLIPALAGIIVRRSQGSFRPTLRGASDLLRYGLPSLLALLPSQFNRRLDQLMMASVVTPEVLGWYAVALTVTMPISIIASPIANVLSPHIAASQSAEERRQLLGDTSRRTVMVLGAVAIPMLVLIPPAITRIFGIAFAPAIAPALVLVPAAVIVGIATVLEDALLGLGRPRSVVRAEFAGLVMTAVGLAATLRRVPLMGAACTSLAAYTVTLCIVAIECKRATGISFRSLLVPTRGDVCVLTQIIRALAAGRRTAQAQAVTPE